MEPAPQLTELATLRELVVTLKAALAAANQENTLLRQKIDALVRVVNGSTRRNWSCSCNGQSARKPPPPWPSSPPPKSP